MRRQLKNDFYFQQFDIRRNKEKIYERSNLVSITRNRINKDLLQQFINDKSILQQKQLAEKYSISLSTVQRLIKKLKSPDDSPQQSQNNSEEQSQNNFEEQSKNQSLLTQNSEQQQSENNNEESVEDISSSKNIQIQQSKSIEEIQQEEQIIDKYLINYLNKPNDYVEIQRNTKEKIQKIIPEKHQIIQQPQPIIIQQLIQQIDLQQNPEDENEIKSYMVKIRKFIQFFSKEESIFHIIGSTEFQQRQFISRLYLKNLEELKLIHKTIEFELLFSRSNSFVQDSIESGALFIERLLLIIDINVVGVYQELQQDEEFQFYMNMFLCESSYVPSAKQILFLKFIKNYYKNILRIKVTHLQIQNKNQRNKQIKNFQKDSINFDQILLRLNLFSISSIDSLIVFLFKSKY